MDREYKATIRPFVHSDKDQIIAFLQQIYPHHRFTGEWFNWKYMHNPHGEAIVWVAHVSALGVVGLRTLWPRKIAWNDSTHTLFQPVDTAVHPAFRGKSLFKDLTMAAKQVALEKGSIGFFNFPNPQSLPGYLKMGWSSLGTLRWFVRPLSVIRFWSRHVAKEVDASFGLTVECEGQIPRLLRDADYVMWRYNHHPEHKYRCWKISSSRGEPFYVVTALMFKHRLPLQVVVDLFGPTLLADSVPDLVEALIRDTPSAGKFLVILDKTFGDQTEAVLRQGFVEAPGKRINFVAGGPWVDDDLLPIEKLQISPGDMDTF